MSIDVDSFIKDAKERGMSVEQIIEQITAECEANKELEDQLRRRMIRDIITGVWDPVPNEPPGHIYTDEELLRRLGLANQPTDR